MEAAKEFENCMNKVGSFFDISWNYTVTQAYASLSKALNKTLDTNIKNTE